MYLLLYLLLKILFIICNFIHRARMSGFCTSPRYENQPSHSSDDLEPDLYTTIHDYDPPNTPDGQQCLELKVSDVIEVQPSTVKPSEDGEPFWMEGFNQRTKRSGFFSNQYVTRVTFTVAPPNHPVPIPEEPPLTAHHIPTHPPHSDAGCDYSTPPRHHGGSRFTGVEQDSGYQTCTPGSPVKKGKIDEPSKLISDIVL